MLAPFARFRLHFRYDTSLPKHSRDPAGVCLHIPSGRSYEDPLVKVGGMGRCVAWVRFCAPVLPIRSGVEKEQERGAVKTLGGGRPPAASPQVNTLPNRCPHACGAGFQADASTQLTGHC
jgi:hypothetical protein